MMIAEVQFGLLITAYGVYLAGMITPGPSILSIVHTALEDGYWAGISKSAGVMCASASWGICASLGLMTLLDQYPDILHLMFVIGGGYLLWLGYKAGYAAYWNDFPTASLSCIRKTPDFFRAFRQGVAVHATNPKAMAVWTTVALSGVTAETSSYQIWLILGGCFLLGTMVLLMYVSIFAHPTIRGAVQKRFRLLYGLSSTIYIVLAGKLLLEPLSMIG